MDVGFCLQALEHALSRSHPEIFNSDQGSQLTSHEFTERLEAAGVRISMDGRGRVFDNIFIERLWPTVKYEDIYLKEYTSVPALVDGLKRYFAFYNTERLHIERRKQSIIGDRKDWYEAAVAVTSVGLRPPSVTARCPKLHGGVPP